MSKRTLFIVIAVVCISTPAYAFWMWTPETNKWVNPKYAVKDTPQEQLDYALEFYAAQDYAKAIAELTKLIKNYPLAREAAEAQFYIAACQYDQGKLMEAFKQYQIVIEKYPFSDRSTEVIKRQFDIGNDLIEGKARRNKFMTTLVGGDYDVIEIFRTVIKNAPYSEYAAPAQYTIGLYLLEKEMYQEARDEFEKTVNDFPDSEWAQAAQYQIALADAKRSAGAQYDQKVTESAIAEFKGFVQENPGAELTQDARKEIQRLREKEAENNFLVAQYYEKQKKFDAAKIYYSMIVEDYSKTSWAQKALEQMQELNTRR